MTYYNTLLETGEDLKQSQVKAETQTEKVLRWFQQCPGFYYTPFEIHQNLKLNCPVTSVRRAMTDLTKQGKLKKTKQKKQGEYGKLNYCWRLKSQEGQTSLFD